MFNRERTVFFNGFLDGENLSRLTGEVEERLRLLASKKPDSPPVLCITSPGGHLASSYGFFERIILFGPRNVHTVALDDTSSAALFLYIAGEKRFVAPHTTFFVHRLLSRADDYSRNISGVCKKEHVTPEYVLALMTEEGTELTAEDALMMGLANELLSPEQEQQLRAWRDEE